jgi:hypothetical protein
MAAITPVSAASLVGLEARVTTGSDNQPDTNAESSWPLEALIPLYVYPTYLGSYWDVIEADPTNVGYIVANPDTGPGTSVNSDYTMHIANMRAKGIKVLGYVDTDYAGIALATVKATMGTWVSYYAIDGFFFDRCPNAAGSESYYASLNSSAKSTADMITVNNYGSTFGPGYMPTADIHVITENTEANLLGDVPSLVGYEFVFSYPPSRFCHVIFDATAANLHADLAAVTKRHSSYVFLTSDANYGSEPAFWSSQQAALGGLGAVPAQGCRLAQVAVAGSAQS